MSSHALLDIFFDKASQILKIYGVDSSSLSLSHHEKNSDFMIINNNIITIMIIHSHTQ